MRASGWEWVLRFCILPLCLRLNHCKMVILVSFKKMTYYCMSTSNFLSARPPTHTVMPRFSDDGSSMNSRRRRATAGSVPWTLLAALIMIYASCSFLDTRVRLFFLALAAHFKRDSSHGAFLCRVRMLSTCSARGVLRISLSHIQFLPTAPKMCWKATISPMKQLLPASSVPVNQCQLSHKNIKFRIGLSRTAGDSTHLLIMCQVSVDTEI